MKRIFITGICGFVGSNLANYFLNLGYRVYGIDNLSRKGTERNYKILKKKGIIIFKKDLAKLKNLKLFKKKINFQTIIHCAALTSVLDGTNSNSTDFLYNNNFLSTLASLKLCKQTKSKFIFISSSRVYAITDLKKLNYNIKNKLFFPKKNKLSGISDQGINEYFPTNSPNSFYGSSKLICEAIIQEYCKFYNIPFIINRCGLLAGSGQFYKSDQGIISFWINSWKNNKKLNYIDFGGFGYQTRDCLHPKDLCALINKQITFLKKRNLKKFIFNVSGGISSAFSLKELSIWCEKYIFPKKVGYQQNNRPFDLKWIVLDNTAVKKLFKWKIQLSKYKIFEEINSNDNS